MLLGLAVAVLMQAAEPNVLDATRELDGFLDDIIGESNRSHVGEWLDKAEKKAVKARYFTRATGEERARYCFWVIGLARAAEAISRVALVQGFPVPIRLAKLHRDLKSAERACDDEGPGSVAHVGRQAWETVSGELRGLVFRDAQLIGQMQLMGGSASMGQGAAGFVPVVGASREVVAVSALTIVAVATLGLAGLPSAPAALHALERALGAR